jgi:ribosomal protein S12 methylthiotransferase accessory factor
VEPGLTTRFAEIGDTRQPAPERKTEAGPAARARKLISSGGTSVNDDEARFLALAEGLERYCTSILSQDQILWGSANELGQDALDLDKIPQCSDTELADPKCQLVRADKQTPIRWVRGLSLHDGRIVYVPVVMVYSHAGFANTAERFWHSLSTGCAGHSSYEKAILNAALEVVERDAISIVWLQKLPLPRIEVDTVPRELSVYWDQYQRCSTDLEYVFFDATSDLRLPTIYGLQLTPNHERAATLVSCATNLNPAVAIAKVMREMAALRIAYRRPVRVPDNIDDFCGIMDGATYMARAEHASAFEFLLESGRGIRLSEFAVRDCGEDLSNLSFVLDILFRKGLDVYAVDLSTDESLRTGTRVVRVVIPGLQPLSFHHRSRYLGHPRLYEAPKAMGYPVLQEDQLNEWPQPFA